MIGALTRLIDQAELSLSELTRRTVESVTVPIRAKSQELMTETVDTVLGVVKTVAIKAVLGLVGAIMAVVAIVYAVAAFYEYLLPRLGAVEARLVLAGVFLGLAVVAIVLLIAWPKATPTSKIIAKKVDTASEGASHDAARIRDERRAASARADAAARQQAEAVAAAAAASANTQAEAAAAMAPPPVDLASGFDTMVAALGEAGFRREQAGLRAGLALASQLKPMQIVSLALIGGFIAATRYPRRG